MKPLKKIALIASMLSTSVMANENDLINQFDDAMFNFEPFARESKQKISTKDQPDLYGEWVLKVSLGNRTIHMDIDREKLIGDVLWYIGNIKSDGKSVPVVCSYVKDNLFDVLGVEISCLSESNGVSMSLGFSFDQNVINKGYYGLSDNATQALMSVAKHEINLVGFRKNENQVQPTVQPTPEPTPIPEEAFYNETTEKLILPHVIYRGNAYSVSLKNTGNFQFSIDTVSKKD